MQDEREDVLGELRALGKKLDGVMKLVGAELPQALKYKEAAFQLGMGITELKEMIRLSLIRTVTYKPGGHPRVPLSEIRRLTTPAPLPTEAPRGKPSRQRRPVAPKENSPAATRAALKAALKR